MTYTYNREQALSNEALNPKRDFSDQPKQNRRGTNRVTEEAEKKKRSSGGSSSNEPVNNLVYTVDEKGRTGRLVGVESEQLKQSAEVGPVVKDNATRFEYVDEQLKAPGIIPDDLRTENTKQRRQVQTPDTRKPYLQTTAPKEDIGPKAPANPSVGYRLQQAGDRLQQQAKSGSDPKNTAGQILRAAGEFQVGAANTVNDWRTWAIIGLAPIATEAAPVAAAATGVGLGTVYTGQQIYDVSEGKKTVATAAGETAPFFAAAPKTTKTTYRPGVNAKTKLVPRVYDITPPEPPRSPKGGNVQTATGSPTGSADIPSPFKNIGRASARQQQQTVLLQQQQTQQVSIEIMKDLQVSLRKNGIKIVEQVQGLPFLVKQQQSQQQTQQQSIAQPQNNITRQIQRQADQLRKVSVQSQNNIQNTKQLPVIVQQQRQQQRSSQRQKQVQQQQQSQQVKQMQQQVQRQFNKSVQKTTDFFENPNIKLPDLGLFDLLSQTRRSQARTFPKVSTPTTRKKTPTLRSILNMKQGATSESSYVTGLGERFLPKKKKKKNER